MKNKHILLLFLNIPVLYFLYTYYKVDPDTVSASIVLLFVIGSLMIIVECILLLAFTIAYFINNWNETTNWLNKRNFKN